MNTTVSFYNNSKDSTSKIYVDFYQIINYIKTNDNLKSVTEYVRSGVNKKEITERKEKYLPMICYSGIFNYRSKSLSCLDQYSNIIIIDLDNFISNEDAKIFRDKACRLIPSVIAAWISPKGLGVKIAILHNNTNPEYNEELYKSIASNIFKNDDRIDFNCTDLSRGCFLCYDKDIYINPNPIPYNFIHSDSYVPKTTTNLDRIDTNKIFVHTEKEINENSKFQALWKDKTLINYVDKYWTIYGEEIVEGNRNITVLKRASKLCKYGVLFENALEYLIRLFTKKGLDEMEITKTANYSYNRNRNFFGTDREDLYNRKVLNTENYKKRL